MKRALQLMVVAVLALGSQAAWGQAQRPATLPGAISRGPGGDRSQIIDALDVPGNSVNVGQFLGILKQKVPGFQYVANTGRWQEVVLPRLNLRNVTVSQVIELLKSLVPHLDASSSLDRDASEFWLFRDDPLAYQGGGVRLVAFGLNDPVDRLALRKSWSVTAFNDIAPTPEKIASSRKEALKEVLSLLEAAISQSSAPGTAPSLKLHEETGVLLVTGSDVQIIAITQALEALKSGDDPNQLKAKYSRLTGEYESIKSSNHSLLTRTNELETRNRFLESSYNNTLEQVRRLKHDIEVLKESSSTRPASAVNGDAADKR